VIERDRLCHGIEVKYQNAVSGWDEFSIAKGIGRGVLVTRDTFEFAAIPRIPPLGILAPETVAGAGGSKKPLYTFPGLSDICSV